MKGLYKITFILSLGLSFVSTAAAENLINFIDQAKTRCEKATSDEAYLVTSDFSWDISLKELEDNAREFYNSGKRLKHRAYYDESAGEFVLYLNREPNTRVVMPEMFVYSVKRHIEEALKLEYVQEINYADMGHSHFFIPQDDFDKEISPLPISQQNKAFERMLNNPRLKILYHTAEQLKMKDEDGNLLPNNFLKWRYFTRNPVGDNMGQGLLEIFKDLTANFNTVKSAEGYRYWGAGAYINASKDGCFSFKHKGEKYYFDISLESLPYKGTEGEW